jgi:UPF0755 protein
VKNHQPKQKNDNSLSVLLTISGFAFIALSILIYLLYQGTPQGEFKEILIQKGSSIAQVTKVLQENNIITHPLLFKGLLRFTKGEHRVRAGEFRFHSGMSAIDALKVLYYNEPIVHQVVIPEGYSIKQIAESLAAAKLVDPESFTSKALSSSYAKKYNFAAPNLEGFLFPDTYTFSRVDGEEKILDQMVQNFIKKTGPQLKSAAERIGMTLESVVTLASIIEKETGNPDERPLVSSVFHNRLRKGMKLQSDPTTIYAIPNYKGNITKADLQRYHPYNTYTIPALPPGPIASPGLAAINAALNPAQSDYLFFVASIQGNHIFSKTYSQHSREVTTHQILPHRGKALGKVQKKNGKQ